MKRYKNGVTTFDAADIDAAFGIKPNPLGAGMVGVGLGTYASRRHLAMSRTATETLCSRDIADEHVLRDVEDSRFMFRLGRPCRNCNRVAASLGIEVDA